MFQAIVRFLRSLKPKTRPVSVAPPILDPAETIAADEARNGPAAGADVRAAAETHVPIDITLPHERICGISPTMSHEEIAEILARLYQRHNRAASSFDSRLRAEAEFMLDAIAGLREKYLSRPPGS